MRRAASRAPWTAGRSRATSVPPPHRHITASARATNNHVFELLAGVVRIGSTQIGLGYQRGNAGGNRDRMATTRTRTRLSGVLIGDVGDATTVRDR